MLPLEGVRELVGAEAGRNRKRAEVIGAPAVARRHEVGERRFAFLGDRFLLPQHVEPRNSPVFAHPA